jgi:hypothetical protein
MTRPLRLEYASAVYYTMWMALKAFFFKEFFFN